MSFFIPYIHLMRLHRPVGIYLLFIPSLWGILLADGSLSYIILFAIGSVVMRSAGCVINDIWDRDIDPHVERTKNRPLANGTVSLKGAIILLAILMLIGLYILFQLNILTIKLGVVAAFLLTIYPLAKRFSRFPQIYLAAAFSMAVLMGYSAVTNTISISAIILFFANMLWVVGYDTIYALQDVDDDKKMGVNSTALTFGSNSLLVVNILYFIHVIMLLAANIGVLYYIVVFIGFIQLNWQIYTIDTNNPNSCMTRFKSNIYYGFLIAVGLI